MVESKQLNRSLFILSFIAIALLIIENGVTLPDWAEIIILIVYLPILSLEGIEGKMFKPMAQTVSFAILGAFILSLTYVPMASALFLSKNVSHKKNISDKIIDTIYRFYQPVLDKALQMKALISQYLRHYLIKLLLNHKWN